MRIQPRIGTGLWGLVMAVLVVAAAPTWASETTAKIVKVQGLVEVSSASPGQWASAPAGRVLRPGDAVRTGSRSSAIITLGGAEVTLYETTLLRIPISTSRVSNTGDSPWRHPSLDQGRGLFNVTPGRTPAGFSVRTPMLVAGVKGTIFEVIATGTEHAVYVWEGAVEVSSLLNPTDLQLVAAGEHTMMDDLRLTPSQSMPVERERPAGADRNGITPDTAPDEGTLDDTAVIEAWREADRIAVDLASDGMADFQTIISSGELRQPVTVTLSTTSSSTSSTSSSSATTTPTHAASTVTDPVASSVDTTLSTVTDPLLSTVDTTVPTPTDPLLASTVTDPVASSADTTLSTVTDPLLSTVDTTVSTVTDPLLATIDTTTTSVIDPLTGSTTQLVDSASGLLGL